MHKKKTCGTLTSVSYTQAGLHCIKCKKQESNQHQSSSIKTTFISQIQQATIANSHTKTSRALEHLKFTTKITALFGTSLKDSQQLQKNERPVLE